jgi:YD repeat-containing protein
MKKHILVLLLSLIQLSCNHGYNTNVANSQNLLPIKSVQTYSDGQVYGGHFEYKGDKLTKSVDVNNKYYALYHYTGDLITKIEQYAKNKKIINTLFFEYDTENRLVKEYSSDGIEINYIYNPDGSITAQNENNSKTIYVNNNKIVKEQYESGDTYEYEHDNKNNPLKNIIGMDKLFYSNEFGNMGTFFNIIKKKQINSLNPFTAKSDFSYNEKDFPTEERYVQIDEQNKIVDNFTIVYHYNN